MNGIFGAWLGYGIRVLVALTLLTGLSACNACDENLRTIGVAASIQYDTPGTILKKLAYSTWEKNETLEKFMLNGLEKDSVETFIVRNHFKCSPSPAKTNCTDCHSCNRTTPVLFNGTMSCIDSGPMLVQVEFGPGKTVSAMTYWKQP